MGLSVPAQAALAGAAFVFCEAVLQDRTGLPPVAGAGAVGLAAAALGGLHAAFAALARRLGPRALLVPVVLWAFVWGPDQARLRGAPPGTGYLAPLVLGAVGAVQPVAAAALALAGAMPARPRVAPLGESDPGPHLLLVTVDTVRAEVDLLGALPPEERARWTTCPRAVAPAPWTPPSVHSLMLGAPVDTHGAGVDRADGLTARAQRGGSLPEAWSARGYATAAYVTNPHLRREAGFADGFDGWHHDRHSRLPLAVWHHTEGILRRLGADVDTLTTTRDARTVRAAQASLRAADDGARFTWVHLMGPHEYRRGVGDAEALRGRYDRLSSQAAAHVAALVMADPDAVVVVTSDHGELLGEGGRWGHGQALAAPLLHVPLAIRARVTGACEGGWVAASDLRDAWLASPEAPRLPMRERVRVGGVRGSPEAAGWWADGNIVADGARPTTAPSLSPDRDTRRALQVLGYVEP